MFCPNCGKNLPENAAFCDGCGTRLGAAPAPAAPAPAAAPAAPNPMVENMVSALKSFFSAKPCGAVENASKSKSLEWIILIGITAFFRMFYSALFSCHNGGSFEALGLLGGLLYTSFTFGAIFGLVLVVLKLFYNKNANLMSIFNVTAVAMLPLGCGYLANIIFGFVWNGLTATVDAAALIACAMLLYIGIQKLGDVKISLWVLIALIATVLLTLYGWSALWGEISGDYSGVAGGSVSVSTPSYADSVGDALGSYSDMIGSFF